MGIQEKKDTFFFLKIKVYIHLNQNNAQCHERTTGATHQEIEKSIDVWNSDLMFPFMRS